MHPCMCACRFAPTHAPSRKCMCTLCIDAHSCDVRTHTHKHTHTHHMHTHAGTHACTHTLMHGRIGAAEAEGRTCTYACHTHARTLWMGWEGGSRACVHVRCFFFRGGVCSPSAACWHRLIPFEINSLAGSFRHQSLAESGGCSSLGGTGRRMSVVSGLDIADNLPIVPTTYTPTHTLMQTYVRCIQVRARSVTQE